MRSRPASGNTPRSKERRRVSTDRSGWWQLLLLVPVIGWIVLIVFWVQESRPNRYAGSTDAYA
ncbi:DUF805 domain-containing protein [Massilia aerilata]|uniref:DUF805 domain-containing protein n=1 Tax=Massilia aerilata TaxID=453817 RepID=A0ABW0RTS0_9BURK